MVQFFLDWVQNDRNDMSYNLDYNREIFVNLWLNFFEIIEIVILGKLRYIKILNPARNLNRLS